MCLSCLSLLLCEMVDGVGTVSVALVERALTPARASPPPFHSSSRVLLVELSLSPRVLSPARWKRNPLHPLRVQEWQQERQLLAASKTSGPPSSTASLVHEVSSRAIVSS